MSTTVTAQTVIFFTSNLTFNQDVILADSGIQQAAAASLGNDMLVEYKHYYTVPGGVPVQGDVLMLTFFVTPAVALNIIAGIPALVTRMQIAQPQINRIVTWGQTLVFN